ncbi:MAG: DNA polymerase III subunit delta [Candidatus Omnitrophota bacterium]|nr:DNA polymerase III subunit delta [Candidatus Omnitrophota bacterium]
MVTASPSVFLFVGREKYLKERAINELRSRSLDSSSGELDYKVLYGADTTADEIINSSTTIPFFSSKRLIVIKDFDKLSKEDTSKVITYIKNPSQHTCLIIDSDGSSILKDEPSITRYAKVLKFAPLSDNELSVWIRKYLSIQDKTIEDDALDMLKESKGSDLLNLSRELDKLITFINKRKSVSCDDVGNLVGKSVVASAFDIASAIGDKNAAKAIKIAHELISSGKKPYEIIGILSWFFKRALKAKLLLDAGDSESLVEQKLRINKRSAEEFFTHVHSFSAKSMESKLRVLLDADLGIKRPRYSTSLTMEFAVIKLCLG